MNILMIDIDTLRPDHLGCYGYERNTSPNIDRIAADGCCFTDYYCSDAPCLPSRAALVTGRYGIHTGVVNHGGLAADMRLQGHSRSFKDLCATANLPAVLKSFGYWTGSISTFSERHSAWWFNAGFNEVINLGTDGDEIQQDVTPLAVDYIERNKDRDWFLHVHYWDPHTIYRTPADLGDPFEGLPSGTDWIDEETLRRHRSMCGFHAAQELNGYNDFVPPAMKKRAMGSLHDLKDVAHNTDGYDMGVYNADLGCGILIDKLIALGQYDDTAIIVTADHGEDLGELGRYSEHGCADIPVTRIPLIIKWPGMINDNRQIGGFHLNIDLTPTLLDLMDPDRLHLPYEAYMKSMYGENWKKTYLSMFRKAYDGESFASCLQTGSENGRNRVVVSLATHAVQRAVIDHEYIYIRTYHDGYCLFPEEMLFKLPEDIHEQYNIAEAEPSITAEYRNYLETWIKEQLSQPGAGPDPFDTVLEEGGGFHCHDVLPQYLQRLMETGREDCAQELQQKYIQ